MPDPRFFAAKKSATPAEVAAKIGATLQTGNIHQRLSGMETIEQAEEHDLIYFTQQFVGPALQHLQKSRAGACITSDKLASMIPKHITVLCSRKPRKAWGQATYLFYDLRPFTDADSCARKQQPAIATSARIARSVHIGPHVCVGAHAKIDAGCILEPGAVIGRGVHISSNCRIGPTASLACCDVGPGCDIGAGSRIGGAGFGFVHTEDGPQDILQLGRVLVCENVRIGAGCSIARGSLGDTVIGAGTRIDDLVMIAHNVRIGRCCVLAAQVALSGSVVLEDGVMLAGQAGVREHTRIGREARIGGQSGVVEDVRAGASLWGTPAFPMREFVALHRRARAFFLPHKKSR